MCLYRLAGLAGLAGVAGFPGALQAGLPALHSIGQDRLQQGETDLMFCFVLFHFFSIFGFEMQSHRVQADLERFNPSVFPYPAVAATVQQTECARKLFLFL